MRNNLYVLCRGRCTYSSGAYLTWNNFQTWNEGTSKWRVRNFEKQAFTFYICISPVPSICFSVLPVCSYVRSLFFLSFFFFFCFFFSFFFPFFLFLFLRLLILIFPSFPPYHRSLLTLLFQCICILLLLRFPLTITAPFRSISVIHSYLSLSLHSQSTVSQTYFCSTFSFIYTRSCSSIFIPDGVPAYSPYTGVSCCFSRFSQNPSIFLNYRFRGKGTGIPWYFPREQHQDSRWMDLHWIFWPVNSQQFLSCAEKLSF